MPEIHEMCNQSEKVADKAVENHLATQAWQVKAIHNAVKKADCKGTTFIDHNQVTDWGSTHIRVKIYGLGLVCT